MSNYPNKLRLAFLSLMLSLFFIPILQSGFSQIEVVEVSNDTPLGILLEIRGDPTTKSPTTYQIIVSGQILHGPNANPVRDLISSDGTTVNGVIQSTGIDNFFFTGNIVSVTSEQPVFLFVDGESLNELSAKDLKLIKEYLDQAKTLVEQRFTGVSLFYYDKVLEIDPLNIDALNGKALIHNLIGNPEEAISYYDKVLLIDPKNNDALLGTSLALDSPGISEQTISNFDKDIEFEEIPQLSQELSEESLESLQEFFDKAEKLLEEENFEDAISYYEKVLTIYSSDIDALYGKALALASIGNHEEAISFYDKALTIDSSDIDALYGKALSLESLGRVEESLSNLEKIETLIPPQTEFRELEDPPNEEAAKKIAESDSILFMITGVFIIILVSIILIDFLAKRKNFHRILK